MISITRTIENVFIEGFRRIKTLVSGRNNTQRAYEAMPHGVDSLPPLNTRAIHMKTGESGKTVIVGYLNLNQLDSLVEGEHRIFSTDPDGALSTFLYLRGDGTMEIGGADDFMVRFNALEDAFNEFKDDYNGHTHDSVIVSVSGGSGAPAVGTLGSTGATDSVSAADIGPAKIEEIKTIGN